MKSLVLLFGLFSVSSYAQDFVKCQVELHDNAIKCGVFGPCPEKELKSSKQEVLFELMDGQTSSQKVGINRILFHSNDKEKVNQHLVFLFDKDLRFKNITKENVVIREMTTNESIHFSASKFGAKIKVDFRTSMNSGDFTINGEYYQKMTTFVNMKVQYKDDDKVRTMIKPIVLQCQKISKEAMVEEELRKEMSEELKNNETKTETIKE
jgi:hypothetical protein